MENVECTVEAEAEPSLEIKKPQPFLKAEKIVKGYRIGVEYVRVLDGVDIDVARGEWIALLGASGCGKTTLLNVLGTLEKPESGSIVCDGHDFSRMSGRDFSRFRSQTIGFVFQAYHLIPEISVLDNVLIANRISPNPDKDVVRRAEVLLEELGMSHRAKHRPYELSGGEQQRASIARALINNPSLILADEPTGNLDRHTGEGILEIFSRFHAADRQNAAIVMVTHDESVAARADRIVRLADGRVV